jgi:acyl-CoA synthetase (AMP-forming)/AMP-acid ligase II
MKQDRPLPGLRYVIFGGEALSPGKLKEWKARYPGARLINMFGITETTVHVTYKEITDMEIDLAVSNIGKPIPTLEAYVLDRRQGLVPIGVAGELVVGGEGVCRGYLNRPPLTGEIFVDTVPLLEGKRLYRSGDIVRLSENGEMVYLGRIDTQVKIRGYRIELGEIENRLTGHPSVKNVVVIDRRDKNGDKYLCAYVVLNSSGLPVSTSDLRNYLAERLPDYMIPSFFAALDTPDRQWKSGSESPSRTRNRRRGRIYRAEECIGKWNRMRPVRNIGNRSRKDQCQGKYIRYRGEFLYIGEDSRSPVH